MFTPRWAISHGSDDRLAERRGRRQTPMSCSAMRVCGRLLFGTQLTVKGDDQWSNPAFARPGWWDECPSALSVWSNVVDAASRAEPM